MSTSAIRELRTLVYEPDEAERSRRLDLWLSRWVAHYSAQKVVDGRELVATTEPECLVDSVYRWCAQEIIRGLQSDGGVMREEEDDRTSYDMTLGPYRERRLGTSLLVIREVPKP